MQSQPRAYGRISCRPLHRSLLGDEEEDGGGSAGVLPHRSARSDAAATPAPHRLPLSFAAPGRCGQRQGSPGATVSRSRSRTYEPHSIESVASSRSSPSSRERATSLGCCRRVATPRRQQQCRMNHALTRGDEIQGQRDGWRDAVSFDFRTAGPPEEGRTALLQALLAWSDPFEFGCWPRSPSCSGS